MIACDLIVIPFSLSRSMLSRTCSFIFDFGTAPVSSSSRSASVDFPWSICAMMQKLRTRSREVDMRSEAHAVGEGDRGLGGRDARSRPEETLLLSEVGVERGEMRIHVGIGHREEMDGDAPPDPADLPVAMDIGLQDRGILAGGVADRFGVDRGLLRVVLQLELVQGQGDQ